MEPIREEDCSEPKMLYTDASLQMADDIIWSIGNVIKKQALERAKRDGRKTVLVTDMLAVTSMILRRAALHYDGWSGRR